METDAKPGNRNPNQQAMSNKIRTYAELRELIRVSLRTQNPEWVEPNGNSPLCDSYEARFAELLGLTHTRKDKAAGS
ncbi:MAG: hypothetical protein JOZ60_09765 [Verrucomicrobia bacterium]|nr:hypothetical protein [Verrucomicrobiota bacterium]